MGRPVSRFEELLAYEKAFRLQQALFVCSEQFPREERYALIDQIRRSSRSVGTNIAEAWHKRRYEAHFLSKLSGADAELGETRHWLHTAKACGYLDTGQHGELAENLAEVGRLLGAMINDPIPWLLKNDQRPSP